MVSGDEARPEKRTDGSPWILRWLDRLPPGSRVLDFAAGTGRHARAAALRGFSVLAIDRDADALGRLHGPGRPGAGGLDPGGRATAAGEAGPRSATPDAPFSLRIRVADLEHGPWPFGADERYDAVIVAHYLFRPRFALLASLVAPGGLLLYETFARGNEIFGRPSNPAYLLEAGELIERGGRAGLTVLEYATGVVQRSSPALIQRMCAIRATGAGARIALG